MKQLPAAFRRHRCAEALLVSGFTFVGALFAAPRPAALWSPRALLFFVASYLVIISIYAFNSWAGLREDRANPRLAAAGFGSEREYAAVSAGTLAGALAFFAFLRPAAIPYALGIFFLWGLYSFPRYGAKYVPVAGTIVHIAVGITQFQQGWALIGEPGMRSLFLSLYFALILSAGHVNHELIDHDADRAAGIVSGAVRFGIRRWILLHLGIAVSGASLLIALNGAEWWGFPQSLPFLVASLLHTASALTLLRGESRQHRFLRHRAFYRFLYGAACICALVVGPPYA